MKAPHTKTNNIKTKKQSVCNNSVIASMINLKGKTGAKLE